MLAIALLVWLSGRTDWNAPWYVIFALVFDIIGVVLDMIRNYPAFSAQMHRWFG